MKKIFIMICTLVFSAVITTSIYAGDRQRITLIDGNSGIENFDVVGTANWSAEDGAIQATEGSSTSFLVSRNSYDNFVLNIEFWVSDDANSGIYMRCLDISAISDQNCYEANIYDQRSDLTFGTGAIVHIGAVSEPYPKAGGKWNTYEIVLNKEHLKVTLNGEETVNVNDTKLTSGPIALQWARGTVRFRYMSIMPL